MTGEGFRPENGSSPADALIGSYNAIEQHQDSIVLDAEKWQGNYSKTFIVTDKTKVPISTLITVYLTYESNDNGGYSIVSIDSVKAEKNSGWTYVYNVATVNGDILYSNQRREAVIPVAYQASIGSGLQPQDCLIRLDLSQIDRLTLPSQDEIDNLHGDTASDDFSISGTVFSYGDESWDLAEQSPAITSLLNCDAVGQYVVITGHGGPKNVLYFIFDTGSAASPTLSSAPTSSGSTMIFPPPPTLMAATFSRLMGAHLPNWTLRKMSTSMVFPIHRTAQC